MPKCGHQLLRSRLIDTANLQPVRGDQRQRVQEIRERQSVPDYMCRYVVIWDLCLTRSEKGRIRADIVERFTLSLMLTAVAFRNMVELSGTEFDFSEGIVLPKSFGWLGGRNLVWLIWTISYVCVLVLFSLRLCSLTLRAF